MRILFAMLCVTFALSLSATAQELAISTTDAAGFRYFDLPASTYRLKSIGNGSKFAQIDVKRKGKNSWDALIHSPTNKIAIKKGDQIVLAAKIKVVGDRADEGSVGLYGESAVDSKEAFVGELIYPTRELKTYRRHFLSPTDLDVGEFRLSIHMALKAQTLELHQLSVKVYPPDFDVHKIQVDQQTWDGREADAPWRKEANARIEKLRKQNLKIVVRDSDGNLISDAKIKVNQKRHAFPFGTFVGTTVLKDSNDGEKYRTLLKENFNLITLPAYLADWGWLNDENRKEYFQMADWAHANGFQTRGHLLVYPGWTATPSKWFKMPKPELLEKLNEHIPRATKAFAARGVRDWDVANELRYNEKFMEEIGGIAVAADWFKLARQCNPEGGLFLAETAILSNRGDTEKEQATLEKHHKILVDAGAPIDGICLQGHFGAEFTSPVRLKEIFDRMTKMGDVMVTEFDMDSIGKDAQADYLRDFYTVCFSHPKVLGVNQWGFWEADMWKPRGHLIDKQWNQTVSFKAYRDLVYGQWWTDESGVTDETGTCEVRAFKGIQSVTVEHKGYSWTGEAAVSDETFVLEVTVP